MEDRDSIEEEVRYCVLGAPLGSWAIPFELVIY